MNCTIVSSGNRLAEIVGERLSPTGVADGSEGQRRDELHVPTVGKGQGSGGALFRWSGISEQGLAQTGLGFVRRRGFLFVGVLGGCGRLARELARVAKLPAVGSGIGFVRQRDVLHTAFPSTRQLGVPSPRDRFG